MSVSKRGENNSFFGKHLPEDAKQKISQKRKGWKITEEQRKLWSDCKKGEKNSNFGKHWDQEHRARLSEKSKEAWKRGDFEKYKDRLNQRRGESWLAKKIVGPDGTVYECLLDAVEASGIPNSTLRGWMKSGPSGKNGWHYLNPLDSLTRKQRKELINSQSD